LDQVQAVYTFIHIMFLGATLALQVLVGCASPDARPHQSFLATVSEPTTAVVLRTFGNISEQQNLLDFYAAQLENSGFRLSVLHDAGNATTASQEQVAVDSSGGFRASKASKIRLVKWGGFAFTVSLSSIASTSKAGSQDIPVCIVSWTKAEEDYGKSTMDSIAALGAHSAHDQFLSLWYRHCDTLHTSFTWFLEADARFSGQVTKFFRSYEHENADLVSSGFRIASPDWWKYSSISDWILSHTTNFSQSSKVVKNLEWLNVLTPSDCISLSQAQPTQPGHGVLFFQDHVMRTSDKLLEALDKCFYLGIAGPSESFVAQMCGIQLNFGGNSSSEKCTIVDFAPVRSRDQPDQWVSESWCWDTVFESSGKKETCSSENKDKWFHKCESNPEYFNCPW